MGWSERMEEKSKAPPSKNRGLGTRSRLGVYVRATRPRSSGSDGNGMMRGRVADRKEGAGNARLPTFPEEEIRP
jgi:hypothetical protein